MCNDLKKIIGHSGCIIGQQLDCCEKNIEPSLVEPVLPIVEPPPILKPVVRKQVDSASIFNILYSQLPDATHIYLSDNQYWLCSEDDIKAFLNLDLTNKDKYVPEEHDCDDFSYRLMGQLSTEEWSGIAFGIVWTNLHALNCFITDTGKFYFIEPQTDKLQEKLEEWQGNEVLFILM